MATGNEKQVASEKRQQSKERREQKASKTNDVIIVSESDHDSDYWVIQDELDEVTESEDLQVSAITQEPQESQKTPMQELKAKVWTATPQSVDSEECMKRRDGKQRPLAPRKVARTAAAGLPGAPVGPADNLQQIATSWPNRRVMPSIRDILAYKRSAPMASPAEIARQAKTRFGWSSQPVLTTEEYTRGMISAYETGRREALKEVKEMLKEPTSGSVDLAQRCAWVGELVEQDSKTPPIHGFDD